MTIYPYILFNQSPQQLRRIGARGGRAYGRNRRARLSPPQTPPQPIVPAVTSPLTTAARAIATLVHSSPGCVVQSSACPALDNAVAEPTSIGCRFLGEWTPERRLVRLGQSAAAFQGGLSGSLVCRALLVRSAERGAPKRSNAILRSFDCSAGRRQNKSPMALPA